MRAIDKLLDEVRGDLCGADSCTFCPTRRSLAAGVKAEKATEEVDGE